MCCLFTFSLLHPPNLPTPTVVTLTGSAQSFILLTEHYLVEYFQMKGLLQGAVLTGLCLVRVRPWCSSRLDCPLACLYALAGSCFFGVAAYHHDTGDSKEERASQAPPSPT